MTSNTFRTATLVIALVAALSIVGCGTMTNVVPTDNAAALAGETTFANDCARCHSASSLKGSAGQIINDLGSLDSAMNGITLTDEEVTNLKAYLATQ
ncbi:MAG: cytochrome c [Phycisphaerales bacterium]|nr:cytochrome c [Phycisphaerales bacterium]